MAARVFPTAISGKREFWEIIRGVNRSRIELEPANGLIEAQNVEDENIPATPPHMNELDVGSGEFGKGGCGQPGFQAGLEDKIFGEVMVAGPIGLGEMICQ